jgi:hypothetical protein
MAGLGVRTVCFHEHWTDIQNHPTTTHGKELDRLVAACHQRKIQLLLYFGYEMSDIAPEWERYHEECLASPRAGGYKRQPTQTAYIVCYRSHWQDFLAQGIDRVMADHKVDGVYLDGTSEPWGCSNRRHGCGYVKPDGSVGTTYPIFATREMMKRIYTIVKHRNPAGQVNVHQSTCMTIPTLAFATSYWDGEQLQSLPRKPSAQDSGFIPLAPNVSAESLRFACRSCWGLTYRSSQQAHRWERSDRKWARFLATQISPTRPELSGNVGSTPRAMSQFIGRYDLSRSTNTCNHR